MSQKRKRSVSPATDSSIFKSSPIIDRSSKFIAFFSLAHSAKYLQAQPEISTATHRIAAWRQPSTQRALNSRTLFDTGHDDDGEKYGGKTLEKVLSDADLEGAIVVARWYGGVLLGPVRFDHLRTCAQEAISNWAQSQDRAKKKQQLGEDAEEKERLLHDLPERDESITVLRELLAEKRNAAPSKAGMETASVSAKVPEYASLPLPALERLEKVRDATIAWILKEIEKAELAEARDEVKDTSAESTKTENKLLDANTKADKNLQKLEKGGDEGTE